MLIGWKPKSEDPAVASVRFRCLTPLQDLQRQGFPVELYRPERASQYDLVVFSKLYARAEQELARELKAGGATLALDLSDNHLYNPRGLGQYETAAADLRAMSKIVDQLICCSSALAGYMSAELKPSAAPIVVGDAVEGHVLPADAASPFEPGPDGKFRIVWFGSHGSPNAEAGMTDLLRLRGRLEHASRIRDCELVVLSNSQDLYDELAPQLPIPSRYRDWNEASFMEELARANLIVIPITPNPFTKCKTNNRLATALWYRIPTLSDRIPAYDDLREFAFLGAWDEGFDHALSFSRESRIRTEAGAAFVRSNFNTLNNAADWRRAFKLTLDRAPKQ